MTAESQVTKDVMGPNTHVLFLSRASVIYGIETLTELDPKWPVEKSKMIDKVHLEAFDFIQFAWDRRALQTKIRMKSGKGWNFIKKKKKKKR